MLTSKQRAYLRGLSTKLETILIIGKGEINDNTRSRVDRLIRHLPLVNLLRAEFLKQVLYPLENRQKKLPKSAMLTL